MKPVTFNQIIILVVVFLVYLFIGYYSFQPGKIYYYSLLAESFLSGNLHLPIVVPNELVVLSDPYDPHANSYIRNILNHHDLSFYKGKFHLYFGATPILLFYAPIQLLIRTQIPDACSVVLFMFGTVYFTVLIFNLLKTTIFNNLDEKIINLSIIVLAFSNLAPYLIYGASMYTIPISCGCFCNTTAYYFLCRALLDKIVKKKCLILGSIFLGLAIGCRPYFVFSGFLVLLLAWFYLRAKRENLILFIPFFLLLMTQLLYNYFRFDNLFEFGNRYQLTCWNANLPEIIRQENTEWLYTLDLSTILHNLNLYLFTSPVFWWHFPFIFFNRWISPLPLSETFAEKSIEDLIGVVPLVPFTLLILLIPIICLLQKSFKKQGSDKLFPILLFFLISFLVNFYFLLNRLYITLRYSADFLNPLLISVCIAWFYFNNFIEDVKLQKNINYIAFITGVISAVFGVLILKRLFI